MLTSLNGINRKLGNRYISCGRNASIPMANSKLQLLMLYSNASCAYNIIVKDIQTIGLNQRSLNSWSLSPEYVEHDHITTGSCASLSRLRIVLQLNAVIGVQDALVPAGESCCSSSFAADLCDTFFSSCIDLIEVTASWVVVPY